MTQFEFFMSFYSLLLGLAVTQLLGGFANLLRAPEPPAKIGWLTPLTGAVLLVQIMSSFFDAFSKLQHARFDFSGLALPTLIGMLYFACAVVVIPAAHDRCASLDDYFFRQRKWTLGALVVVNLCTLAIEVPLVAGLVHAGQTVLLLYYVAANSILVGALVVPMFARSYAAICVSLVLNVLLLLWVYSPFSPMLFDPG